MTHATFCGAFFLLLKYPLFHFSCLFWFASFRIFLRHSFYVKQKETNMACSARQKSYSTHDQTYGYQKKNTYITTCKRWMLLLKLHRCYNNIISCFIVLVSRKWSIAMVESKSFLLYFIQHDTTYDPWNIKFAGFHKHCWVFHL